MRLTTVMLIAFSLAFGGCAATSGDHPRVDQKPSSDGLPMGRLGHPIGTYLRIEGARAVHGKVGVRTLSVDTVNGEPLEAPVGVWIDNVSQLPLEERCVLWGFESARWIGIPPEVERATGLRPQARWQLYRFFVVTSVDKPRSLTVE